MAFHMFSLSHLRITLTPHSYSKHKEALCGNLPINIQSQLLYRNVMGRQHRKKKRPTAVAEAAFNV
jgi:hypothetical protein